MLLIHYLVCFGPVLNFDDSMLFLMVRKCFGCCCERVHVWICVVQWWVLIYSPRRAQLAQARITGIRPGFLLERSPRRGAVFLGTNCLVQARPPCLSESSRNLSGELAQSRLSESLQLEREHSSRLSEDSQFERDLAGVLVMLHFMNIVGCLMGWIIDLLYKGDGYACAMYVMGGSYLIDDELGMIYDWWLIMYTKWHVNGMHRNSMIGW